MVCTRKVKKQKNIWWRAFCKVETTAENQHVVLGKFRFEFRFGKITVQFFCRTDPHCICPIFEPEYSHSKQNFYRWIIVDFGLLGGSPFDRFGARWFEVKKMINTLCFLSLVSLQRLSNVHNDAFWENCPWIAFSALDPDT